MTLFFRLLAIALGPLGFVVVALHAQLPAPSLPWVAALSPTTQTLRGVCFGHGQWVAVGEGGVILTSLDGAAWTARPSPVTTRLNAVTYSPALDLFVAVGDGPILTAPGSLTTWTSRPTGAPASARLNSVAAGGGLFLAVGDAGLVVTSPNGADWTTRAAPTTDTLLSVAYGNSVFVATGNRAILIGTNSAGAITLSLSRYGFDLPAATHPIFFANNRFTIIDSSGADSSVDGTEWNSFYTAYSPFPRDTAGVAYSALSIDGSLFGVGNRGSIGTQTVTLPGTNAPPPDWQSVFDGPAAVVTVGTGGSIATYHRTLASGAPVSVVDPTFRPQFNGLPGAILPLADGRVYVAGTSLSFTLGNRTQRGLARLLRDGSVDPTFVVGSDLDFDALFRELRDTSPDIIPPGLGTGPGAQALLIAQPDGRIVIAVTATVQILRTFIPYTMLLARVNLDGSRDRSFTPTQDLRLFQYGPLPVVLPDGRWLTIVPGMDANRDRIVTLARFSPNGVIDPTYGNQVVAIHAPAVLQVFTNGYAYYGDAPTTTDTQGRIYIAAYHSYRLYNQQFPGTALQPGYSNPKTALFRLNSDGSLDTTFAVRMLDEVMTLSATARGLITQENQWIFGNGSVRPVATKYPLVEGGTTTISRLTFGGTVDPTFRPATSVTFSPDYKKLTTAPDGSVYAITRGQSGRRGIVRYDPTGAYDPDFSVELEDTTAQITELFPQPDGQLLVFGTFTSIAGVAQPYLARLTPNTRAGTTRLGNLSVRARAGTGAETLIAGYLSTGGETSVLARAAGPALTQFGISGALPDPNLTLYHGPTLAAANDNWDASPAGLIASSAARLNAFSFPVGSRDAALLASAPAGPHTLQVTSGDSSTGVALLELYAAGSPPANARSPRLANFSARTFAGFGAEIQIVGFTLEGDKPRTLLIRAVGPGLAKFGITGAHADPLLTLFRENATIARNDQWQEGTTDEVFLRAEATAAVKAFPLDPGSKDSALVVTLAPGRYTAQISGSSTGIALVEIYEVP